MSGMFKSVIIGTGVLGAASAPASAYFFDTRFVERIGNTDVVLGDSVTFTAGSTHRLRMQFGVFADGGAPVPGGGYIGWNSGTFEASFGSWTRTPGRIIPFNFAPFPYSNGVPQADPFTELEQIDNTLGPQVLPWLCGPDGQPLPMPQPTTRGVNEFVSTYEVTVDIPAGLEGVFSVTIGGQVLAADRWVQAPPTTPPDCDTGEPGTAWWDPIVPQGNRASITNTLTVNVVIPAPAGAACLAAGLLVMGRRRR